jgi:hypothetical protein
LPASSAGNFEQDQREQDALRRELGIQSMANMGIDFPD